MSNLESSEDESVFDEKQKKYVQKQNTKTPVGGVMMVMLIKDQMKGGMVCVKRDTVIQCKCKHGAVETIAYYRAVAFFVKYYNKWFMALDDKFVWSEDKTKMKKGVRIMARLMKKNGLTYGEVDLVKNGDWGPQHIYTIKSLNDDVLEVVCDLVDW